MLQDCLAPVVVKTTEVLVAVRLINWETAGITKLDPVAYYEQSQLHKLSASDFFTKMNQVGISRRL
jgi:hypothetical protein